MQETGVRRLEAVHPEIQALAHESVKADIRLPSQRIFADYCDWIKSGFCLLYSVS